MFVQFGLVERKKTVFFYGQYVKSTKREENILDPEEIPSSSEHRSDSPIQNLTTDLEGDSCRVTGHLLGHFLV